MKYKYSAQETEILADLLSQSSDWNAVDIFQVFLTSIQDNEIRLPKEEVKKLFDIYSKTSSALKFSSSFDHIEFVKKNLI